MTTYSNRLSKTYYNVLFSSSTRDRHARRIYQQYVAVGPAQSATANCTTGVPQGSVLGPLLFAMYISPVGNVNVVAAHDLYYHQYADDTQLYMAVRPGANVTFIAMSECVNDVARWLSGSELLGKPMSEVLE